MALQLAGSGKNKNARRVHIFKQARKHIVAAVLLAAIPILFAANSQAVPAWSFTLTPNLPTGVVGVPYSGAMLATGGTAPYKFVLTDGNLPAGLALNSTTGAITGTPSAASTTYVWIKATDANGKFATIHPQITVGTSTGISIVVSPMSTSLTSGGTQQFSATVLGSANTAVTWTSSAGTISTSGLFTAPTVTTSTSLTVTATSSANTSKKASAIVVVNPTGSTISVTVSPTSSTLTSGNTQQFSATVVGSTNTAVTWASSSGTISSSGLFTAPTVSAGTSVTVTATSNANTSKKASATVAVNPTGSTISVTVSPSSTTLTAGNTQQFSATVQGTSNTAVTWSATAGTVSSAGMFTAPNVSSNTSVTVTATSSASTAKKASATVAVTPPTSAFSITTSGVPGAQSGSSYSFQLSASGGTTPYQWKVASGSLPQGFVLSSTGMLSGTTTQTGQFSFTAQATDAGNSTASKALSLPVSAPQSGGSYDGPAQLPITYMQTTLANTPGTTIQVSAGASLQSALNSANCGDTIALAAGATFTGQFTVPAKPCDNAHWIIIRTSAPNSALPPEGSRMLPCYAGVSSLPGRPAFSCGGVQNALAKVVFTSMGSGPFQFANGANHYRFIGLDISRAAGTGLVGSLVSTANGASADHIILDRVWLHGSPQDDTMNAFTLNRMSYAALIDSYTSEFHCTSVSGSCTDAHVISGGTSSTVDAVYRINGNFLEASTENILFGGGSATTTPTDIEIRHNHFFKPLIWMVGQPGFVGGAGGNAFMVKNHLELKNAARVLVEGNIFENSWGGYSQVGYSILLTPKNQASATSQPLCPTCAVTDVTIRFNTISHVGAGISLADVTSAAGPALYGERYSIHDVTIDDVSVSKYRGSGTLLMVLSGWLSSSLNSISVNHITGFPDPGGRIIDLGNNVASPPMYGFTFTNNIVGQVKYPIWSTGGSTSNCAYFDVPLPSLNSCFTTYKFSDNAIVAVINFPASQWPTANYFPTSIGGVQFVNFNGGIGGDYHLLSSSPYKNAASDGKDIGADINAIQSQIAGVY
jgi:hypothetical protein